MTVSTSANRVEYNGSNGVVKAFPVPFPVLDERHLSVWLTDRTSFADVLQVLNSNYTVDITPGDNQTSVVNFVVAPTKSNFVTIARVVPITQETDYVANDAFPAELHEDAIDKLTMICQQLDDQYSRGVSIPITSLASPPLVADLPGVTNVFPAQITSSSTNGLSTFAEQEPIASGGWQVKSGGVTGAAREISGCYDTYLGEFVLMTATEDAIGNVDYRFQPPGICS
tara:strand:+ start:1420 stop:2100 length:681 start_codon:yes stop_codon:yes gene_type:complete